MVLIEDKQKLFELELSNFDNLIHSNQGLFKVYEKKGSVGPNVSPTGEIIGDQFGLEPMLIQETIQHEFAQFLLDIDTQKYMHYVLVVIGALETWQDDIKNILKIIDILDKDEKLLLSQELSIKDKLNELNNNSSAMQTIKGFKNLKFLNSIGQLFNQEVLDIEKQMRELEKEKKYLINYINEKRTQMPFLF